MHYLALATDYDGTIAHDGAVDDATVNALHRARAAGLLLVLVTGRRLPDLFAVCPQVHLFDRIVAENGALVHAPATGRLRTLAPPPPPDLLNAMAARSIPASVGRTIVATDARHEAALRSILGDLGLAWHLVLNREALMALPPGVTKATGLAIALEEIDIPPGRTVGVGDAENDHAFITMCGAAIAVANAIPALKTAADFVTRGPDGSGVRELIDLILTGRLIAGSARRSDPPNAS